MIIRYHATPCMTVAYYIEMTHRRPRTPGGVIIHKSSCKHTPTLLSPRMSIDSTHKLTNIIWRYPSTLVNEMDAREVDLLKRCASACFITSQGIFGIRNFFHVFFSEIELTPMKFLCKSCEISAFQTDIKRDISLCMYCIFAIIYFQTKRHTSM